MFAALALSCASAFAQSFVVDPVNGANVPPPTGGTASNPFQSITYAVQWASGGSALLALELRPGLYSANESFPIVLPPVSSMTASWPGAATIDNQNFALVWTVIAPAGFGSASFDGIRFKSIDRCVRVDAYSGGGVTAQVSRCDFEGRHGLKFDADGPATNLTAQVTDSRMSGSVNGIVVESTDHAVVPLLVDDCATLGLFKAFELNCGNGGQITSQITRTRFQGAGKQGLFLDGTFGGGTTGGLNVATIDHCVFYDCGTATMPASGAIAHLELPGYPQLVTVTNTAFWLNFAETPHYSFPDYNISGSCAQSSAVASLWGASNIFGDPLFVDPGQGDFHLRPGSPCIDTGVNGLGGDDVDGDPQPPIGLPHTGAPIQDIGIDEFYAQHVYLRERWVAQGGTGTLVFTGPAGYRVWILLGIGITGSFGSGLQLILPSPPIVVLLGTLGTLPAVGTTSQLVVPFTVPTPAPPLTTSVLLPTQAAFDQPSTGSTAWGFNVLEMLVTP